MSSESREGYIFLEGDVPPDYQFVFPVAVFNRSAYRFMQAERGWSSFYIVHPETKSIHGHIHFYVSEGSAVSPLRAPFGSIEASSHMPAAVMKDFLKFAEIRLIRAGVSRIVVKNPPEAYHPAVAERFRAVFVDDLKYAVRYSETTSIIHVSPTPFGNVIHPRKKRKLKQSHSVPYIFSQLEKESLPAVYEFISLHRTQKKYRLSITLDELRRRMDHFPRTYHIFGVYHMERLVAASVAITVNDNVLYHFISDHIPRIASFSPALVLMEGLYNFCQQQNLELLDLGTSAPDEKPSASLSRFKGELGGKPAFKFTFEKNLV